jgi:hypothetical protein
MTAQMAMCNHLGVALASDSVVTIGKNRTYTTVNKIFSLGARQPVAIMISGAATYIPGGVSWERVVGLFREHIGVRELPRLGDYVDEFEQFVISNTAINDPDQNALAIQNDLIELFTNKIVPAAAHREEMLSNRDMRTVAYEVPEVSDYFTQAINTTIDSISKWAADEMTRLSKDEDWNNHYYTTKKNYLEIASGARDHFCKRHDCESLSAEILEVFLYQLARYGADNFWKTTSKIVFAGFGESQITPRTIDMTVGTKINDVTFSDYTLHKIRPRKGFDDDGSLIEETKESGSVRVWSGSAMLTPYAMFDEMQNMLNGIHRDNAQLLKEKMPTFMQETISAEILKILEETEGVGKVTISKVKTAIEDSKTRLVKVAKKEALEAINVGRRNRRERFRFVTSQIPLNEMAEFAKALVSLEAQIQHYSKDRRFVGGPIDVATITKEDGFLWVDSKVRIDPFKNPRQLEQDKLSAGLQ